MFLAIVAVFYYLAGNDGAGKRLSDWKGRLLERLLGRSGTLTALRTGPTPDVAETIEDENSVASLTFVVKASPSVAAIRAIICHAEFGAHKQRSGLPLSRE